MPSSDVSLETVTRLGTDLLSSKTHINNAPLLLSVLSNHESASSDCTLEALRSLQAFFTRLFVSQELSSSSFKESAEILLKPSKRENGNAASPEALYKSWLWSKYNGFVDTLLQIFREAGSKHSLQVAGLDALMEFTRQEKQGEFSNRIFSKVCFALVAQEPESKAIIEHFVATYLKYFDVCCHICTNLQKISLRSYQVKKEGVRKRVGKGVDATTEPSFDSLTSHVFDILICLTIPKSSGGDADAVLESWSSRNQCLEKKLLKKLRSCITKAWLTFFQLPLGPKLYEKVLGHMHSKIIPNLSSPVLLSDFLTKSYDKGGVISIMALSGLFLLITEHGLEYPDFYNKLYALLEPSMFLAKYRARFFELLDQCLKSPLMPSYLAAAFTKKLSRLALMSPPHGTLIVIAIIHNLLRRHPSINFLVHQDCTGSDEDCMPCVSGLEASTEEDMRPDIDKNDEKPSLSRERPGVDPYNAFEPDPGKSCALQSSLWEMDTLRHHYCPAVSRFLSSLEADLTVRAKTMELLIKDFSSGSYASIFADEVGKRMKQVPLAFYISTPTSLFPQVSSNESSGFMDFPGWTFNEGQNIEEKPVSQGINNGQSSNHSVPMSCEAGSDTQTVWKTTRFQNANENKSYNTRQCVATSCECGSNGTKQNVSAKKRKKGS